MNVKCYIVVSYKTKSNTKQFTFPTKKNTKKSKAKQTVKAEFTAGTQTNYSGLTVIHSFIEKIGVENILNDDKTWHEEPVTFRAWFVQLAGKVAKTGRQTLLKMYEAYYLKDR